MALFLFLLVRQSLAMYPQLASKSQQSSSLKCWDCRCEPLCQTLLGYFKRLFCTASFSFAHTIQELQERYSSEEAGQLQQTFQQCGRENLCWCEQEKEGKQRAPKSLKGSLTVVVGYAKGTGYPEELSEEGNDYFVWVLAAGCGECCLNKSTCSLHSILFPPRTCLGQTVA